MLTPESTTDSPVDVQRLGAAPVGAWEPPDPASGGSPSDPDDVTVAVVYVIPPCDVHATIGVEVPAEYDAETIRRGGPWAFLCGDCFRQHGPGRLGLGIGQRLELAAVDEPAIIDGEIVQPDGDQLGPTAYEAAIAALARTAIAAGAGVLLTAAAVGILHWTGHATKTTDFACWCVAAPLIVCAVCALLVLALPPRQEAK